MTMEEQTQENGTSQGARVWRFGANVDTDQMVPGRYAPYMRPGEDVGNAAFIEADPEFNQHAKPGDMIVADANFGCGSSREYAPLALKRRGIAAIIAPGFARIFYRNAINLGIPLYQSSELPSHFRGGERVQLDLEADRLHLGEETYELPSLAFFAKQVIKAGGIVPYYREHGAFPMEPSATATEG